jgi:hypothetical protein
MYFYLGEQMSLYRPKDRKEAKKSFIAIAIFIIAFAIIAGVAIGMLTSGGASSSGAKLSGFTYANYPSASAAQMPDAGNRYVLCTVTITNTGNANLVVNPNYFTLTTTDGQVHSYSWWVDYSMPSGLVAGARATVTIGFEISQSTTPDTLKFAQW